MKILAIVGTPTKEKGCTTQTVDLLAARLEASFAAEVDYLYLEDLDLPRCRGHLTCVKFGESRCPFRANLEPITARMIAADAVVFASPVHCFNVSTLMKNFIDLYVYQMHRPQFFGKKAVVVTTAAGAGHRGVLRYMRKTFALWGFDVIAQLGSHAGLFGEPKYRARLDSAVRLTAASLAEALGQTGNARPRLAQLINFRVWRSVITRSKDASPYDWQHWKDSGWLDHDYYYPVRVNPAANALAALVESWIGYAIRGAKIRPVR